MPYEDNSDVHLDQEGYDPVTDTYHANHDWIGPDTVSYTIVMAVAALTDREPHALPPLTEAVDPDALEGLFGGRQRAGRPADHLTFAYAECEISVRRDGHIVVHPPGHDPE